MYRAMFGFQGQAGEMSLEMNDVVDVIEKDINGWWLVRKGGVDGWAPSNYLEPVQRKAPTPPPQRGSRQLGQRTSHKIEADDRRLLPSKSVNLSPPPVGPKPGAAKPDIKSFIPSRMSVSGLVRTVGAGEPPSSVEQVVFGIGIFLCCCSDMLPSY